MQSWLVPVGTVSVISAAVSIGILLSVAFQEDVRAHPEFARRMEVYARPPPGSQGVKNKGVSGNININVDVDLPSMEEIEEILAKFVKEEFDRAYEERSNELSLEARTIIEG